GCLLPKLYETSVNAMIEQKRMSIENVPKIRSRLIGLLQPSIAAKRKSWGAATGYAASAAARPLRGRRKRNKSEAAPKGRFRGPPEPTPNRHRFARQGRGTGQRRRFGGSLQRHSANDPQGPQRSVRARRPAALSRRRHPGLGYRQPRL